MNFQKFSLREPLGGNPPDPHLKKHTTPLFSMHLGISRELTPPGESTSIKIWVSHYAWCSPAFIRQALAVETAAQATEGQY